MKRVTKQTIVIAFVLSIALMSPLTLQTVNASPSNFQVVKTLWGSISSPLEAGPGDMAVPLSVIALNNGEQTFTGLNAFLQLEAPFANVTGGDISQGYYAGNVPVGQIATLQFQLNIDANASIGQYPTTMSLRYQTTDTYVSKREDLMVSILLSGRVEMDVAIDPTSLSPGSTNKFMINVSNEGTGSASKVSIALNFPSGLSTLGSDNQWDFQSMAPNETISMVVDTFPHYNLAGSLLQVGVTVSYTDAYGTSRAITRTIGVKILPITNAPLEVVVKDSDFQPGKVNTLTLTILNNHTMEITSVEASLTPPSALAGTRPPLVISGDNNWFFPSVAPSKNVTFNVELVTSIEAAGTNYQLTVNVSYLDPFGTMRTEIHTIGIRILPASKDVFLISIDDDRLIAGSFNEPVVTINNVGKTSLHSFVASLSFPTTAGATSPIISSMSKQWHFDIIRPNESVTFSPRIFSSLSSMDESYEARLSISYQDEFGIDRVETRSLGFSVRGAIKLEVFNGRVVPKVAAAGGNVTVTGDLVDTGTTRALYTTMSVKPSPVFLPLFEGSAYLGEISTNVPIPFSISAMISRNAANDTYPLTLVFVAQDDYGEEYTVEKNFNITVRGQYTPPQSPEQPVSPTLHLILEAIPYITTAVLLVLVVFMAYQRRKGVKHETD